MDKIAIIPARGGSQRIPKKNIKSFFGKPVIAYSIEVALESKLFDEVMVSTDDEEIASIAISYGAKVPFLRSIKNSDHFATTASVIHEVLSEYEIQFSKKFDFGCCIYPVAPLINPNNLVAGYEKLVSEDRNTVFPVLSFRYPIWKAMEVNNNGNTVLLWPEFGEVTRSQDLKTAFHDAGQWYWIKCNKFIKNPQLFTDNSGSVLLEEFEAQDIDTLEDWFLAESKYKFLKKKYNGD